MTRHLGAFLAMLALLLQMGVPLAHDPTGLAGLGAPLCHVGARGGAQQPAQGGASVACPLCLAIAAGANLAPPPAAGIIAVAAPLAEALPPPADAPPRVAARFTPSQPRGPPFVV